MQHLRGFLVSCPPSFCLFFFLLPLLFQLLLTVGFVLYLLAKRDDLFFDCLVRQRLLVAPAFRTFIRLLIIFHIRMVGGAAQRAFFARLQLAPCLRISLHFQFQFVDCPQVFQYSACGLLLRFQGRQNRHVAVDGIFQSRKLTPQVLKVLLCGAERFGAVQLGSPNFEALRERLFGGGQLLAGLSGVQGIHFRLTGCNGRFQPFVLRLNLFPFGAVFRKPRHRFQRLQFVAFFTEALLRFAE